MTTLANGAASHKRELSWDDVATGNLPPHAPHVDLWRQAVSQAAATLDTPPYNDGKGKLQKAMDLVLENKVQAHEDSLWTVQGSTRPYGDRRRMSLPSRATCGVEMVQASGRRGALEAGAGAAACREWERQW